MQEIGPRAFVFVITMAGHGPWSGDPATLPPALAGIPEAGQVAGWLDAMRATDTMLPILADALGPPGPAGWPSMATTSPACPGRWPRWASPTAAPTT